MFFTYKFFYESVHFKDLWNELNKLKIYRNINLIYSNYRLKKNSMTKTNG